MEFLSNKRLKQLGVGVLIFGFGCAVAKAIYKTVKKETPINESNLNNQSFKELKPELKIKDQKLIESFSSNLEKEPILVKKKKELRFTDEDINKRILIIGDDKFLRNSNICYKIAKDRFNINEYQLEIIDDYNKMTNLGKKFVNKIKNNRNYIGVIFGSHPHSISGDKKYLDLINNFECENDSLKIVKCYTSSNSSNLKITKNNYEKALEDIVSNYLNYDLDSDITS